MNYSIIYWFIIIGIKYYPRIPYPTGVSSIIQELKMWCRYFSFLHLSPRFFCFGRATVSCLFLRGCAPDLHGHEQKLSPADMCVCVCIVHARRDFLSQRVQGHKRTRHKNKWKSKGRPWVQCFEHTGAMETTRNNQRHVQREHRNQHATITLQIRAPRFLMFGGANFWQTQPTRKKLTPGPTPGR